MQLFRDHYLRKRVHRLGLDICELRRIINRFKNDIKSMKEEKIIEDAKALAKDIIPLKKGECLYIYNHSSDPDELSYGFSVTVRDKEDETIFSKDFKNLKDLEELRNFSKATWKNFLGR